MFLKNTLKQAISYPYYYLFRQFFAPQGNRVLIYHSLGSKLSWGEYGISINPKLFKEHMVFLAQYYKIIHTSDIPHSLKYPTLSITLDDGYKDNILAYEICEEFQIPFTIFISTQFIGQEHWLSQKEIKEIATSPLCTIGSHGHSHTKLSTLSPSDQKNELSISKAILEDIIGKEVSSMSYPHGSYNTNTLEIAKELGYKLCFSSHIGVNTYSNLNSLRLKRMEIISSDDLANLEKKILGFYDFLALRDRL